MDGHILMSKSIMHAKPVWGWSVFLLSTLLLSPTAGTLTLHVLAQAYAAASQTPAPGQTAAAAHVTPGNTARRSDEEWTRLRARGERPLLLRWDTQPDTVAILLPAHTVLLVPDEGTLQYAPAPTTVPVTAPDTAAPSRAPPACS